MRCVQRIKPMSKTEFLCTAGDKGIHDEKNRQLHIILAIIVSVFSACVIVLVAYMVIFPANPPEAETRPGQSKQIIRRTPQVEDSRVTVNPIQSK